jgi:hypothetical protein
MTLKPKTNTFPLFWLGAAAVTLGESVYYNSQIYNSLPPWEMNRMSIHEQVHVAQQKKTWWPLWVLWYIVNPWFRYRMEAEAYKKEFLFLKKNGLIADEEKARVTFAKALSSWTYLKMARYSTAYAEVKDWT